MKVVLAGLLASVVVSSVARAAEIDPAVVQLWDVVYTADGVLKGVIVEEVPGTSIRVVLVGGSSIVVQMAQVTRLTKELLQGRLHKGFGGTYTDVHQFPALGMGGDPVLI